MNRRLTVLEILKMLLCTLAGATLGGWMAFNVQFVWYFFGATQVTLKEIMGLWAGGILIPSYVGLVLGSWWAGR